MRDAAAHLCARLGIVLFVIAVPLQAADAQRAKVPTRASAAECRSQADHINTIRQRWDPPNSAQRQYIDAKMRDYETCCQPSVDDQCVFPWRNWPGN